MGRRTAREQVSEVPVDPQAAAFFDVDNTMMMGASIFHFAKGLAARKFFSGRDLFRFTARQARLRLRGESHGDLHKTRESALAFIAGKSVAEIVALGEEIYDEEMADRIWSGTYALARAHLDAGQQVWLVTATPVELATIIADRLRLTGALGTVAEANEGCYTGHLIGDVLHGVAKAEAVRALAEREGLELAKCTAYSDSINDMPMLSMVGTAVAINPDSALRAEAKQHGWQIRDFRTGRKAAVIGVPTTLGAGAVGGAVAAGFAIRRIRRERLSDLDGPTSLWRARSIKIARLVRRQSGIGCARRARPGRWDRWSARSSRYSHRQGRRRPRRWWRWCRRDRSPFATAPPHVPAFRRHRESGRCEVGGWRRSRAADHQ